MISLKVHNLIDYIGGIFLIATPWIFGMADILAARNVFLVAGIGLVLYSLATNYYYSLARLIPLGAHMTFDALIGVFLVLAPQLFGYREYLTSLQYSAQIVLAVGLIAFVALTKPRTETSKSPVERAAIDNEVRV